MPLQIKKVVGEGRLENALHIASMKIGTHPRSYTLGSDKKSPLEFIFIKIKCKTVAFLLSDSLSPEVTSKYASWIDPRL